MPLFLDTDWAYDRTIHGRMGTDMEKSKTEFRTETPLKEYEGEIKRMRIWFL